MDETSLIYYQRCLKMGLNPKVVNDINGFELSVGRKKLYFRSRQTPFNNNAAAGIACNKYSTNKVLEAHGIPVPKATAFTQVEFEQGQWDLGDLSYPLVIKPTIDTSCGEDVICSIRNPRELYTHLERLFKRHECLSLEEYHGGLQSFRILVFYGQVIALTKRTGAHVIGDGTNTIQQLVERDNAKRDILAQTLPLGPITLNDETTQLLEQQRMTLESVPKPEQRVMLRMSCNSTHGGIFESIETKLIHKDNARLAVEAARVLGLNLTGFDVICQDISTSMQHSKGFFLESNQGPDIRIHELLYYGTPTPVSERMIKRLIKEHRRFGWL